MGFNFDIGAMANAVAKAAEQAAKGVGDAYGQDLINRHAAEYKKLDAELAQQYPVYVENLNDSLFTYYSLLDVTFNPNMEKTFAGSIGLARSLGVDEQEILKSQAEIDSYFLE